MIVTKTPLRVSLFGGGTDFPEYYRTSPAGGGAVIGFALDRYVYVTARELPPFFDHRHRLVWSEIELVRDLSTIHNPIFRAALEVHWDMSLGGLELHYDADLPARSGLGSSSAFTVGLLLALDVLGYPDRHRVEHPDKLRWRLTDAAIHLERETIGEPGGHQDQVFAAYGGFSRIDFGPDGWRVRDLGDPAPPLRYLLLFYTGRQRLAPQLEGIKAERLQVNRTYLNALRRLVDRAEAFLNAEDYEAVGLLLHESWELKKRLAPGVSYAALDDLYDRARATGAWGGKLLGAGGGGFLLVMADPKRHPAIREALSGLLEVPISYSSVGVQVYTLNGNFCPIPSRNAVRPYRPTVY